jgi:hypothetical protein
MTTYDRQESSCNDYPEYRSPTKYHSLYFTPDLGMWVVNPSCNNGGINKVAGGGGHEPYVAGEEGESDWQCYSWAQSGLLNANLTVACVEAECPEG